jgi:SAM-dependent methyltransferase
MCDLLELSPGEEVLEIGTGCGYHAAVTAEIVGAENVYSVEYVESLAEDAERRLDRLGYEVAGCDVSQNAAQTAAKAYDLSVDVGRLPEIGYPADHFDVVVYNHSLEHVSKPLEYAAETERICEGKGHVVIAVPNSSSLERWAFGRHWSELDVPRHVYHWNPGSLDRLMNLNGFELIDREFTKSPRPMAHSLNRTLQNSIGIASPSPARFDPVCLPLSLLAGWVGRSGRFLAVYSNVQG